MAERSPPIVVGIKSYEQRHKDDNRDRASGIDHKARDRRCGENEDDGEPGQQDIERDLVGRSLTLGAFDQLDHAIEERRPRRGRDAHANPVGKHLRAAGDRGSVAAGFTDHRCRLAGDRRLVDGGDTLDHLAVGRDVVAGFDEDDIADLQAGARDELVVLGVRGAEQFGLRLGALASERIGLGLAATLGDGLGEVGKQHREPQPHDDLELESDAAGPGQQITHQDDGREHGDDLEHENHRVLNQGARIELGESRGDSRPHDGGIEKRRNRHALAGR